MLRAFPSVFFNANQHLETEIWEFLSVGSRKLENWFLSVSRSLIFLFLFFPWFAVSLSPLKSDRWHITKVMRLDDDSDEEHSPYAGADGHGSRRTS